MYYTPDDHKYLSSEEAIENYIDSTKENLLKRLGEVILNEIEDAFDKYEKINLRNEYIKKYNFTENEIYVLNDDWQMIDNLLFDETMKNVDWT